MSSFQETKSFLASRPLSTLTAASRTPFTVAKWHKVCDAVEVRRERERGGGGEHIIRLLLFFASGSRRARSGGPSAGAGRARGGQISPIRQRASLAEGRRRRQRGPRANARRDESEALPLLSWPSAAARERRARPGSRLAR